MGDSTADSIFTSRSTCLAYLPSQNNDDGGSKARKPVSPQALPAIRSDCKPGAVSDISRTAVVSSLLTL